MIRMPNAFAARRSGTARSTGCTAGCLARTCAAIALCCAAAAPARADDALTCLRDPTRLACDAWRAHSPAAPTGQASGHRPAHRDDALTCLRDPTDPICDVPQTPDAGAPYAAPEPWRHPFGPGPLDRQVLGVIAIVGAIVLMHAIAGAAAKSAVPRLTTLAY